MSEEKNKKTEQEKVKKLTLNDFIAKAKQKEKDKLSFKDVQTKAGLITMQKLDDKKLLELMDQIEDCDTMKEMVEVYKAVIYESVPTLRKKELQENFKLVEPYDIVTQVFEISEIVDLAVRIIEIHGLNDIGEDIKN